MRDIVTDNYLIRFLGAHNLPTILTRSPVVVGDGALSVRLASVFLILASLGGSSEEGLAGVATDTTIVHVGNCNVSTHMTVVKGLESRSVNISSDLYKSF